jgi:hypothetical protein
MIFLYVKGATVTNSTKALIIAVLNALLGVAVSFNIGLSDAQTGAIMIAANAVLALIVGLTYKNSPKRIPDA